MQPSPHTPSPISASLLERFEETVEAADQNVRRWVMAELAGLAAR